MTIRQKFFLHNLMNKVKRYIEACHICLKTTPKYKKNRPVYGRIPVDYAPMQDLSIDIKMMPQAFGDYHLLLVITCNQTNFTIAVPLRDRQTQTVVKALIYRVIYLFGPPRQIVCDKATEFTSVIVKANLMMLNCRLKVISPFNHGSSKCERKIKTISEIIVKHLWDVAIICYHHSLCYEHVCIKNIKQFFTFSTCFVERPTRPYKSLISKDRHHSILTSKSSNDR